MIIKLTESLLNKLGLIVLFAFMLSRTGFFRRYVVKERLKLHEKIIMSILFGIAGILMSYWGTPILGGIANSRTVPIVIAGIMGGSFVGTSAGFIAGFHRMFFLPGGELTAVACGISTIVGGIIAGLIKPIIVDKEKKWVYGLCIGLLVEFIQMGLILLITRPFESALTLVKVIFIPMTFLNSSGIAIFLLLIQQIFDDYEKVAALKAQIALSIANKTLPFLRKGLNYKSAQKTCEIIFGMADVDAVAITDKEYILAHEGAGSEHHLAGNLISTNLTKMVLKTGKNRVARKSDEIECNSLYCPLKSSIVVPLKRGEKVIGTLKLYKTVDYGITESYVQLAVGLGILFSTQIELSELSYQKELLEHAKLEVLQAQIQPHFFFNTLNTIVSLMRTDVEKAREILVEFSYYLRSSFKNNDRFISLEKEIRTIKAYLSIEKERFSNKLKIDYDIEKDIDCILPPLILQPIVENAIIHGLLPKKSGGKVQIKIYKEMGYIIFKVKDNGIGIKEEKLLTLLNKKDNKSGLGLQNINDRLISIYGQRLIIKSQNNKGTEVSFKIPE